MIKMKEEITRNKIKELDEEIRTILLENNDLEQIVNKIMNKSLLFTITNYGFNEAILRQECLKYSLQSNKENMKIP